ncbi:hypothetical protein VSR01_28080 [Actinacidiphila sp. DG2A-62]|jgi:hypothetical protein|uniref:hypothetical protein n=1 Tax=Actinacidiphila sp. DG2A-62 TaxID=3108821 RepID=UPI002DB6380F|nr:hypothetical protein [Actinacidiphila sp. DG2A-62]MEC3997151.1 hypothetical protein [Actinacidiphila sp. DG2A-62]
MPPLAGSVKAVAWGERCRHQLVTAAYQELVSEGEFDDRQWAEVEEAARLVDRAGWWIDQRNAEPVELPELLAAATDADRTTENPYH